jgi:hypothetical protein
MVQARKISRVPRRLANDHAFVDEASAFLRQIY